MVGLLLQLHGSDERLEQLAIVVGPLVAGSTLAVVVVVQ